MNLSKKETPKVKHLLRVIVYGLIISCAGWFMYTVADKGLDYPKRSECYSIDTTSIAQDYSTGKYPKWYYMAKVTKPTGVFWESVTLGEIQNGQSCHVSLEPIPFFIIVIGLLLWVFAIMFALILSVTFIGKGFEWLNED